MIIVLVVSSVLALAVIVGVRITRPRNDAISQHQRALAALRDAEQSRLSSSAEAQPAPARTDHVRILDEAPVGKTRVQRRPRAAPRRPAKGRRRNAAEIAARPTVARLPTMWLSVPADETAFVEPSDQ